MPDKEARALRIRTTAYAVWTAIGVAVLLAGAGWVIGRVMAAIVPFIIAGVIAFMMHGVVDSLDHRRVPRGWAVIICFVVALAVLTVAGIFLIPPLMKQIQAFATEFPRYLTSVEEFVNDLQQRYTSYIEPTWLNNVVRSASQDIGGFATRIAQSAGGFVLAAGQGVVTAIVDVFLGLVVAFWVLKDLPTMRRELDRLAGPRFEDDAEVFVTTVDRVVGGYLKGQTIASLVTGLLATIGLAIIGVPYALVLGVITFVLNYIPYAGPFVAGLIAGVVGLFVSPLTALLAIAVVIVAQNLTDNLVTPKVMSEQVNLHPILIIFSLLAGGTLAGIPGMIFAIPIAALVHALFVYYYERRTRRQLASETGALFKVAAVCDEESEDDDDGPRSSSDECAPSR